jgi:hypothetical protein
VAVKLSQSIIQVAPRSVTTFASLYVVGVPAFSHGGSISLFKGRGKALRINLCPHPNKTLHLGLKFKCRVLHIVYMYTLCKSVGNGQVYRERRGMRS